MELTEGATRSLDETQESATAPQENLAAMAPRGDQETTPTAPEPQAPKKVVKKLALGQELQGIVTRVTDFGAFVDIGVGRDGLVHVSELSGGRVNKVSDVLSKGQQVTVWIKALDREKNRISLTMRKPASVDIKTLKPDMTIKGVVTRIVPYGAFVDIDTGREALLHVREMSNEYVKNPADIVSVGQQIEARIIKVDRRSKQVDLSIKTELPPAEPEPAELPEQEEESAPTAMELALKAALAGREKLETEAARQRAERRKKKFESPEQEDILARTLDLHKKAQSI